MSNVLDYINNFYIQTSINSYKTLEQCKAGFENESKIISKTFEIDDLESLFLLAIIINNTEYKNCQLEDIADRLEVSRFEVLDNVQALYNLQSKNLVEIIEPEDLPQEKRPFANFRKYPIDIMNKDFVISRMVENKIFNEMKDN